MGHKRARSIKEIHVSEHDLLVGDYRRSHRAFDYVLDFGFVLRTQQRQASDGPPQLTARVTVPA